MHAGVALVISADRLFEMAQRIILTPSYIDAEFEFGGKRVSWADVAGNRETARVPDLEATGAASV